METGKNEKVEVTVHLEEFTAWQSAAKLHTMIQPQSNRKFSCFGKIAAISDECEAGVGLRFFQGVESQIDAFECDDIAREQDLQGSDTDDAPGRRDGVCFETDRGHQLC